MDKQVERFIKACHPCQLVGPRSKPEPIRSTDLPEAPWSDIAVDLLEIPATHVTRAMEGMFRTHGLPHSVRSDNGTPFASTQLEGFLDYLGIEHKNGYLIGYKVMAKLNAATRPCSR